MKTFVLTLALLMAGLVFLVPPLIAVLPALLVGLLLMASPLIMSSLTRDKDGGRTRDLDSGARHDQRPTTGTTPR
ncbi:MAG TPA: hypothetical protein VKD71_15400 [Gemmataceae bacterium]|nr:hypothetical protein [Gemmataceae bacterium]